MIRRFHISPKTGDPKPCKAKPGNCPHGSDSEHFGTEAAAREHYEKMQANGLEGLKKGKKVGGKYDGERDVVDGRPGRWSTSITRGWGPNARPTFFPDDAGMQDDPSSLPDSFVTDDWRNVARPTLESGRFTNMLEAQREALETYNGEDRDEERWMTFSGPIGAHVEELSARLLNGESSAYTYEMYDRNFKQMSPKEMAFAAVSHEERGEKQPMELILAFPDRNLAPVLERLGVEQVSVSPLKNGREVGLVYTVLTPNGGSRSFSVYEHRNTDSIIINGEENWDPIAKPYGPYPEVRTEGGSKWDFFAEFSPGSYKQAAESLGYLLKAAQNGKLESDAELVAKAEHLDWGAILSKQIPAFGEWLESEKNKQKEVYKSDDFVNRSFDLWSRSFLED